MRVFIDSNVHASIQEFYDAAMMRHATLDFQTVQKKITRLYDSLETLGSYPALYAKARLKEDWIASSWREYICEDFHFAYEICEDDNGEDYVWVRDAVHSMLYIDSRPSAGILLRRKKRRKFIMSEILRIFARGKCAEKSKEE